MKPQRAKRITAAMLAAWPLPPLDGVDGKEDRGRVLVIGGSRSLPGAVRLAGEAALRAGAGKLQLATSAGNATALGIAVPEAKVSELPTDRDGEIARDNRELSRDAMAAAAIVIGPGMSPSPATLRIARALLRRVSGAVVLDAGAIGAVSVGAGYPGTPVITPHAGEMARLLGLAIEVVRADAASLALAFAAASGVVTVLKGSVTFIASPDGRHWEHRGGCVGLATSGTGDVLAGLIGGLVARGASAEQAAVWGVYLHGRAGRVLARRNGDVGFLAREIAAEIPRLMPR